MAAQWPLVVTELLTALPTLSGWGDVKVIDSQPVDDGVTGLFCTVGYVEGDDAGSYTQARDQTGCRIVEAGEVKCQLIAQGSKNDLAAVRALIFPLADAFHDQIRANYRLNDVLSPDSTSNLSSAVTQQQTSVGPWVSIIFTFSYSTIT